MSITSETRAEAGEPRADGEPSSVPVGSLRYGLVITPSSEGPGADDLRELLGPDHLRDDLSGDPGDGVVDLGELLAPGELLTLAARARAQAEAMVLERVHAIGQAYRSDPGRDEFAADEVAGVLGWSRTMAASLLTLASEMFDRLPGVGMALRAGSLDEVKAETIAEFTRPMPDDLAEAVAHQVLPVAPRLTKHDLIALIEGTAVVLDPDWAARREQAARARARVTYQRNPQGTGTVSIRDIGPEDTVAMKARTDALAVEIRNRGRANGVRVGIAAVRALIAVRSQDGTCVGMSDDTFIATLVEQLPGWLAELTGPAVDVPEIGPGGSGPDGSGPDGSGPDGSGPDGSGPDGSGPDGSGPDGSGPDGSGPDGSGPDGSGPDGGDPGDDDPTSGPGDGAGRDDDVDDSGVRGPADDAAEPDAADPGAAEPDAAEPDAAELDGSVDDREGDDGFARLAVGARAGTAELRLRLSTALGLDELPAHVPAYGRVIASTARRMLDDARAGEVPVEWRLVLTDTDSGHLRHVWLTRPDPAPPDRHTGPRQRGRTPGGPPRPRRGRMIVELAAPTTMLAALSPDDHPGWAGFIRRARARLADLTDVQQHGGADHPAGTLTDARRRRAGRELDRWTRVRDRHCIGAMCAHPAHGTDLDHTIGRLDHGETVAWNLGACCRHCHRLKHDGGWTLTQPDAGRFVWNTLLGARHTVLPRPVLDTPAAPLPPRAGGAPRPVIDAEPPPGDDDTGWIGAGWPELGEPGCEQPTRSPRYTRSAGEPVRRAATTSTCPDEPPF